MLGLVTVQRTGAPMSYYNTLTMFLEIASIYSEFHSASLGKNYIFGLLLVNVLEIIDIWKTSSDL